MWMLTFFISAVVAGLVAWRAFVKTEDLFTSTLGNRTDTLGIEEWPFMAMMAIGYLWAGFIFVVQLYQQITGVFRK